jgi:two-component system, OmpR family, phosphate regulon sensor histidine kinase PhoR
MINIRLTIHKKILLSFFTILAINIFLASLLIKNSIETFILQDTTKTLLKEVNYLRSYTKNHTFLSQYAQAHGVRITIIHIDGTVQYDSEKPANKMENHSQRFEIIQALDKSYGVSVRYSATVKKNLVYVARQFDPNLIRISVSLGEINEQIKTFSKKIILSLSAIFIFLLYFSWAISQHISKPIKYLTRSMRSYSFNTPMPTLKKKSNDEVGELTEAFNEMSKTITLNIKKLKELETIRKEFISNISHELKTPLTSISGFMEMLLTDESLTDKDRNHFLLIINRNISRLKDLIDEVLLLHTIEKELPLTKTVDAALLIRQVIDTLKTSTEKKLSLNTHQNKIMIQVNPKELYSAFSNYIVNAINYSTSDTIEINLTCSKDSLNYSVCDDGPGIDEEHLPRIFERFYRPDKDRSREDGGTGLGLAIVKNIVEKYDGKVGVDSSLSTGSTFYFKIPLKG